MMQPAEIILRMHAVTGVTACHASKIINQLIAENDNSSSLLMLLGLNEKQRKQFQQVNPHYLRTTLKWLENPGNQIVRYGERNFPERLTHINGAPLLLMVKGDIQVLQIPQIAMVGSRQFSHYGERWGNAGHLR